MEFPLLFFHFRHFNIFSPLGFAISYLFCIFITYLKALVNCCGCRILSWLEEIFISRMVAATTIIPKHKKQKRRRNLYFINIFCERKRKMWLWDLKKKIPTKRWMDVNDSNYSREDGERIMWFIDHRKESLLCARWKTIIIIKKNIKKGIIK